MRLAVAGGGTGGHLFPGLAVAELARDSGRTDDIVFFGSQRGIEARAVPEAGFEFIGHPLSGVVGKNPIAVVKALSNTATSAMAARRELLRRGTDVMIGLGSFASTAAVLGALSARIPVVILEQNRHPGVSNKFFGRFATAVCVSFDSSRADFPLGRSHLTGNPIRSGISNAKPYGPDRDLLLVFGGSGGARSLNRAVVAALVELAKSGPIPEVLHQSGRLMEEELRALYAETELTGVEVRPFIDDMAAVYGRARLAVCRAGATSIAELGVTGTPSVLIPLATSAGDHQVQNARAVEEEGAAEVVLDDQNCAAELAGRLANLLSEPTRLISMAESARRLGRPQAASLVLDVVEAVAAGNTP